MQHSLRRWPDICQVCGPAFDLPENAPVVLYLSDRIVNYRAKPAEAVINNAAQVNQLTNPITKKSSYRLIKKHFLSNYKLRLF